MTLPPFDRLIDDHGSAVWRVCRALLPAADADDAWADTFTTAWQAYPSLRDASNLRGWLVTIAHRKSIDVLRRQARVDPGHRRPSTQPAIATPTTICSTGCAACPTANAQQWPCTT